VSINAAAPLSDWRHDYRAVEIAGIYRDELLGENGGPQPLKMPSIQRLPYRGCVLS